MNPTPMSRRSRTLWILVGVCAVLAVGLTAAAAMASATLSSNMIHVAVHEHGEGGHHIELLVPAPIIGVAAVAAPRMMDEEARAEIRAELGHLGPHLSELLDELADMPDATLVEVEDDGETVVVRKEGGRLLVTVRSADADVDVAVPINVVRSTVASLDL